MTKLSERDTFAAFALAGVIARYHHDSGFMSARDAASWAYSYADAMLEFKVEEAIRTAELRDVVERHLRERQERQEG